MLKPSAGKWSIPKIIRTTIPANTSPDDFIGQKITGESSLATAIIVAGVTKVETTISFAEYELDPDSIDGTFTIDETVNAIHKTDDHLLRLLLKVLLQKVLFPLVEYYILQVKLLQVLLVSEMVLQLKK